MEKALGVLAKQAHAPDGLASLLDNIHKARLASESAKTTESRAAIMKKINTDVAAFQKKMVLKQQELQQEAKALAPVASHLQERLTRIEAKEKEAMKHHKEREEHEAKMKPGKLSTVVDKEAAKTNKILKYLEKKNNRQFHKKVAQWNEEKKVLIDAIKASKEGKSESVVSSIKKLTHIEKGDQDFL